MHIQVKVIRLPEAAKIRRFASRQLASALARFGHFVQSASLSLDDLNGPNRGGVDKHGRLVLRLRDQSVLVIEEVGTNSVYAVRRLVDRLHHAVSRSLARFNKRRQRRETVRALTAEYDALHHAT